MARIKEVDIQGVSIERLAPLILRNRIEMLQQAASEVQSVLGNRRIFNINSTSAGGGVAEMMLVLLAYARGSDIDVRWLVIEGNPEFFALTKRIHNGLHGSVGDGGSLGEAEHAAYEQVLKDNAQELEKIIQPGDIVILHDPQTAGLLESMRNIGATVIWRCHIGSDDHDSVVDRSWNFLRPYIATADAYIFTRAQYAPAWLDRDKTFIVQPSIDPFSPKNVDISSADSESILCSSGIFRNHQSTSSPLYTRSDGSIGTITRKAKVLRSREAPMLSDRTIVQVSRWDYLKDMQGVMEGFANYVTISEDVHLMLVGPSVSGVADDPEGELVMNECIAAWEKLPDRVRSHVHLVELPMEDRDENAIIVNAIQRNATIVVQKSVAEGFGLTVTEAMWKGRPVVASEIGGIPDQIVDGEHGVLINNPRDLEAFGEALNRLLGDPPYAEQLGQNARARVISEFLADRHLEQYVRLIKLLE